MFYLFNHVKFYKDAWSSVNNCFSYTASKEYKTWLSETEREKERKGGSI